MLSPSPHFLAALCPLPRPSPGRAITFSPGHRSLQIAAPSLTSSRLFQLPQEPPPPSQTTDASSLLLFKSLLHPCFSCCRLRPPMGSRAGPLGYLLAQHGARLLWTTHSFLHLDYRWQGDPDCKWTSRMLSPDEKTTRSYF